MKKTLFEEFETISKIRSRKEKISAFQRMKKENEHILLFLHLVFNSQLEWVVNPKELPKYKPCDDNESSMYHRLRAETRKLPRFIKTGPYPNLAQKKRDELFQTVLETIHPQDAELLVFIVENRELPFTNLKKDLIQEAFPKENFGE